MNSLYYFFDFLKIVIAYKTIILLKFVTYGVGKSIQKL